MLVALFFAAAAVQMVVLASLFAVLFGGTFLPVVDWLQKRHLPRWLGALLVLVLLIALGVFIVLVILYGLVKQLPVIQENLQAAFDKIDEALASTSVDQSALDSMKSAIGGVLKFAATGAAGTVASIAQRAGVAHLRRLHQHQHHGVGAHPGEEDRRLGLAPRAAGPRARGLRDLRQQRPLLPRLHLRQHAHRAVQRGRRHDREP